MGILCCSQKDPDRPSPIKTEDQIVEKEPPADPTPVEIEEQRPPTPKTVSPKPKDKTVIVEIRSSPEVSARENGQSGAVAPQVQEPKAVDSGGGGGGGREDIGGVHIFPEMPSDISGGTMDFPRLEQVMNLEQDVPGLKRSLAAFVSNEMSAIGPASSFPDPQESPRSRSSIGRGSTPGAQALRTEAWTPINRLAASGVAISLIVLILGTLFAKYDIRATQLERTDPAKRPIASDFLDNSSTWKKLTAKALAALVALVLALVQIAIAAIAYKGAFRRRQNQEQPPAIQSPPIEDSQPPFDEAESLLVEEATTQRNSRRSSSPQLHASLKN